ncbi:helix-turn-helix domain-containing protein [Halosquirtibacter xylanolyticus]|uniref:helix-turn-helix domain-containing protein n=1 Tax=Halosquirtibacter xylanolyticus TaxID=3374599 RepID=UPI0037490C9B|nr:helix-turn-helix domain-containing protein [Prolixibacteraceae bacterium]
MTYVLIVIKSIFFFVLSIIITQIIRYKPKSRIAWIILTLALNCIIFYSTYSDLVLSNKKVFFLLFPISVALPFTYALFCKEYFSDENYSFKRTILILLVIYFIDLLLFLISFIVKYRFMAKFGYLISISILVYATLLACKGYKMDLVQKRRISRYNTIIINAIIGITLLISFSNIHPFKLPTPLIIIALISQVIFISLLVEIKVDITIHQSDLYTNKTTSSNNSKRLDDIITRIKLIVENDKIYRVPGLTITDLSDKIGIKEYLVRRAINSGCGYTNFNQFLNNYRIKEAKETIIKSPNMSMKEISYQLGYANPSSFNRAFKGITNLSPSEFKKMNKNTSISE